jgi:hypothetical protein
MRNGNDTGGDGMMDAGKINIHKDSGGWYAAPPASEQSELAAWALNKVAALNRCDRGGTDDFFYPQYALRDDYASVPDEAIDVGGGIVFLPMGYDYPVSGSIIKPFGTFESCIEAVASIGGAAVMVKVLKELERMF